MTKEMKHILKNRLARAIFLIGAMILGLFFAANAQVLSCDNKINFNIKGDTLYVVDNNLNMMPMVRYEFVFHLENHSPVSLIYVPDKFNGKISVKILPAKMFSLRYYSLTKIDVHSPFGSYESDKINDKFYFINNL